MLVGDDPEFAAGGAEIVFRIGQMVFGGVGQHECEIVLGIDVGDEFVDGGKICGSQRAGCRVI